MVLRSHLRPLAWASVLSPERVRMTWCVTSTEELLTQSHWFTDSVCLSS